MIPYNSHLLWGHHRNTSHDGESTTHNEENTTHDVEDVSNDLQMQIMLAHFFSAFGWTVGWPITYLAPPTHLGSLLLVWVYY